MGFTDQHAKMCIRDSGKAPGVRITQTQGGSAGAVSINVRGLTSITGNNQPLIIRMPQTTRPFTPAGRSLATSVGTVSYTHLDVYKRQGKYAGTVHESLDMFLVGYLLQSDLHWQV